MTTLPEPAQDAEPQPPRPTPSPWSVPRADGPLAAALRRAQAERERSEPSSAESHVAPGAAPRPLEAEIEALAREARERDDVREAIAIALEWPEAEPGAPRRPRVRAWMGWIALAGALVLAIAAAVAAIVLEPTQAAPAPSPRSRERQGLKLERHLSSMPADAPAAEPRS